MIENLSPGGNGGDDAGVVGFTPSQNTASPNNTVNASRLLVDAASTNADAVIQPKGTGALQAQLADGTATGGNKRGTNAVDLQTSRATAAQVASGIGAFAAGASCTASGSSSVAIGQSATATGNRSVAIGGEGTSSGGYSVSLGASNATADYSTSVGYFSEANRYGMMAHASGRFSNFGDAQREEYVLRRSTTDATPTELTCDGAAGTTTNRMTVAIDSAYVFSALIVARGTAAGDDSAGYKIEGCIERQTNTVQFVGTPTVTVFGENQAGWDCTATADDTNKALVITVTGAAVTTIRWVASVRLVKVTG
jgi:hypothetical protein